MMMVANHSYGEISAPWPLNMCVIHHKNVNNIEDDILKINLQVYYEMLFQTWVLKPNPELWSLKHLTLSPQTWEFGN